MRIFTLAPGHRAVHLWERAKNTLISPSGGCAHPLRWEGGQSSLCTCGLGHAGGQAPDAPRKAAKAAASVNQLVSQQSLCQESSRQRAEVPWLQHGKRDPRWVSSVLAFPGTPGVAEREELSMVCCLAVFSHLTLQILQKFEAAAAAAATESCYSATGTV